MEKNEISFDGVDKPHDRIVKWSFGRPQVSAGLFESYSPNVISKGIDWSALTSCPGSFVDPELVESHTDLLFKAPVRGTEVPVYFYFLFEHLTNPDRNAVLRLAEYKLDIWNKLRSESKGEVGFEFPYILTFVVHQGDHWNPPTRIAGLMNRQKAVPSELLDQLQQMELDMEYIPVFVPDRNPEEIKGHILGRVTLGLMNAARENRCLEFFNEHAAMIDELLRENDSPGMLRTLLRYTFQVDDASWQQHDKVIKKIKSRIVKENVMSIAEQLKTEGRKEGRAEGRFDLVCQILEDRVGTLSASTREKVRELPDSSLILLLKQASSFDAPKQLEEWLENGAPES